MVGLRRSESPKDQIVKAALGVIAEQGADRVTRSDVVKALRTTRSGIARYFPTEDDFWRGVIAFIERQMTYAWSAAIAEDVPPVERLRSLLAVQIGLITATPALPVLLFSRELHAENEALRQGLAGIRRRFQELISLIVEEGKRSDRLSQQLDSERVARRIVEMIQGMVLSVALSQESGDFVEEALARLELLLSVGTSAPGEVALQRATGSASRKLEASSAAFVR